MNRLALLAIFVAVSALSAWLAAEELETKPKDFGLKVTEYVPSGGELALKTPTHIAFGPGGQEIVTDLKNHRLLYRSGPMEAFKVSPVPLKGPHSVVYSPADKLYYVNDTENHRIISFADLGSEVLTAETKAIAGVTLKRPHDVVVDPATGWVYAINPNSGHAFRFKGIGKEESVIKVPVNGYARALTFANGKLYAIGSARGRMVEIVDWEAPTFKIHDSFDPTKRQGPAGSWTKTGLVLNDAEFYDGFWYASSYFTKSYAKGTNFDEHKFIRFKSFEDFAAGKWTDLSSLVPSGMTPYYLTAKDEKLYLAIFNHEQPGKGDSILQITPDESESVDSVKVRVAAYNVEFSKSATPEEIGEMFKPYKLDLIGFNEAPDGDWTARVGKVLGMEHSFVGKISSANHKDKYKTILSRTPLEGAEEFKLSGRGWNPASTVRATTKIGGVPIAVYSLHICKSGAKDGHAHSLATEVLPNEKLQRVVVVGDFNNQMGDEAMDTIGKAGYMPIWGDLKVDLSKEFTYNAQNPAKNHGVIDHILYHKRPGVRAMDGGVIEMDKALSDHKPVWAELVFPRKIIEGEATE